jgi:hypothetical protein
MLCIFSSAHFHINATAIFSWNWKAVIWNYVPLFLFCLGQSLQSAELSRESQTAAVKEEEVKSVNQTSVPTCGTNGGPGMLIVYHTHSLWPRI